MAEPQVLSRAVRSRVMNLVHALGRVPVPVLALGSVALAVLGWFAYTAVAGLVPGMTGMCSGWWPG